jgi:hypothetical protein
MWQQMMARKALRLGWLQPVVMPKPGPEPVAPKIVRLEDVMARPVGTDADG